MIHKPTNPSPYNTVVNLNDYPDELVFSASVYNSSPIMSTRFQLNTAEQTYYTSQDTLAYTITWTINENKLPDPQDWPYNTSRYIMYLWDSWAQNWIAVGGSYWSSYEKFYSLTYNSATNVVTAMGIDTAPKSGSRFSRLFSASRTTTPRSDAAHSNLLGNPAFTRYSSCSTYEQKFIDEVDTPDTTHSNSVTSVMLPFTRRTSYSMKTKTTDTSSISCILYGTDSALLQPNGEYSWRVRLYEAVKNSDGDFLLPNNCLGYGFIGREGSPVQLRPHTNIEYNKREADNNQYYLYETVGDGGNNRDTLEKYYININGHIGQITEFWNSNMNHGRNVEVDSYNDALYSYAQIKWNGASYYPKQGDQYAIYCNYVDSDEFYFSVTDKCELSLSYLSSGDTSTKITGTSISMLGRSDFTLIGEYSHPYGAVVSRYRVLLYKLNNSAETLVDDTEYIQDSYISYSYNQMISGEKYRLDIEVIDTNDYTIRRSVDISVDYSKINISIPKDSIRLDSYPQHNSIIIDWSKAVEAFQNASNFQFIGFDVYKTMGDKDTLHQVSKCNTTGIIEDFLVGDRVEYIYYIYPIFSTNVGKCIQSPIISQPITLSQDKMKLIGLRSFDEDNNIYEIDTSNIWSFGLKISDNGATVVNSKTFTDTLSRYSKETVGPTQYVTKQVSGLLGKIDCSNDSADYIDTYDNIIDWRNFVAGSQLKAFVDLRGVIYICDTEANPTDNYDANLHYADTATFTIHEIDSLDYLSVLARDLKYNPCSFMFLADGYDILLRDKAPQYLTAERMEET